MYQHISTLIERIYDTLHPFDRFDFYRSEKTVEIELNPRVAGLRVHDQAYQVKIS